MLRSDPQPPDQRDPAWLLRSGMAWALTGAVVTWTTDRRGGRVCARLGGGWPLPGRVQP
jgi:hypothetical protein